MAVKYARAAGGNWNTAGTWSTTSGGAADTTVPTAADDVRLDAASGNVVLDVTPVCRSIDCTGYTGTLSGSANISIGDATAGAGNVALKFVAGMTYTHTGTITFVSTSTTQQTIDFAGKSTGNVTYNPASGGSWIHVGTHSQNGTGSLITLTRGALDLNGQTMNWGLFVSSGTGVRVFTLGASAITLNGANTTVWSISNATNFTLNAGTSVITLTGNSAGFQGSGALTYNEVVINGAGNPTLTSGVFAKFTRTGTTAKTDQLTFAGDITMTEFVCNGNSSVNRILLLSSVIGTPRTLTVGTVTISNTDLRDIVGAGAGDWNLSAITGLSGDCGGNSGITFTSPTTQTFQGTAAGAWSDVTKWTSRVPLPQDDVIVSSAFVSNPSVTLDMPRIGKNVDFSGSSGNFTITRSVGSTLYGSLALASSALAVNGSVPFVFEGRGNHTIGCAGKTINATLTQFSAFGGTYTLLDDFRTNTSLNWLNGTFITNNFSVSALDYSANVSSTRAILLGTSTVNINRTNATVNIWNFATTTGLTFDGANATFICNGASNLNYTFQGGGLQYGSFSRSGANLGTGVLIIAGSNTFREFTYFDTAQAKTLRLTAGIITNVLEKVLIRGVSGQLLTIDTTSNGVEARLTKNGGIVATDYVSVRDLRGAGTAAFYMGSHSTNVSGNTNLFFTDPRRTGPFPTSFTA